MKNENLHANHRERVRNRFANDNFCIDSFEDHQVLEYLLFHAIPRIDTNEHAHRLLDRFGSFRDVLDAKHEDLVSVEGIGENTATFIKLLAATARRYAMSESKIGEQYDTIDKVGKFLTTLFMGATNEKVYLLTFNGKNEMTSCKLICEGTLTSSAFSLKSLMKIALNEDAAGIVIAHNHPTGLAVPSGADIEFTSQLRYICQEVGINLLEHIIVAGNSYAPTIKKNLSDVSEIHFKKF